MKSLISLFLQLCLALTTFSSSAMLSARSQDNARTGLQLSETSVVLENVGYSAYIEAHMVAKSGSSTDVQRTASWSSDDSTVALADSGRLLALKKGSCIVTASYGGDTRMVKVTVKNDANLEQKYAVSNGKVLSTAKVAVSSASLRNEILEKCSQMINYSWVPTQDLTGFDHFIFQAGTTYHGIPYTYSDDLCDEASFAEELDSKYFYVSQIIKGVPQPYYGSDCSGFISLVWGLSERYNTEMLVDGIKYGGFSKVGSYNTYDPDRSDLLKSYAKLQPGDAVVLDTPTHGHTFIIADNEPNLSPPQLFAYEQSPPYCQFSNYTYDTLLNFGFLPFTLKALAHS